MGIQDILVWDAVEQDGWEYFAERKWELVAVSAAVLQSVRWMYFRDNQEVIYLLFCGSKIYIGQSKSARRARTHVLNKFPDARKVVFLWTRGLNKVMSTHIEAALTNVYCYGGRFATNKQVRIHPRDAVRMYAAAKFLREVLGAGRPFTRVLDLDDECARRAVDSLCALIAAGARNARAYRGGLRQERKKISAPASRQFHTHTQNRWPSDLGRPSARACR